MNVGIFGGSFDPIHVGHLWIGEYAMDSLSLDQLRWVPAATSPLKPKGPSASDEQRCEMLRLAIAGRENQIIDDCELRRDGVSYSVDTVRDMQHRMPEAQLFLIIGSDSLATMKQWHQPEILLRCVRLAVVQRGGESEIDFSVLDGLATKDQIDAIRGNVIRMPVIEVSSYEIRDRVRRGKSIRYLVPRAVEAYLRANNLYRDV